MVYLGNKTVLRLLFSSLFLEDGLKDGWQVQVVKVELYFIFEGNTG